MWGKLRRFLWLWSFAAVLPADVFAQQGGMAGPRFEVPSFIGGQTLKDLEQARSALEIEARRKSEDARIAGEAELKRKAEEERRAAAEAEVKRKAEEVRRLSAIEAEARRRVGDERRILEQENEAKKRADERFKSFLATPPAAEPTAPPATDPAPSPPAAAPSTPVNTERSPPPAPARAANAAGTMVVPAPTLTCGPATVTSAPLPGGRMRIDVASPPCRAGQLATIAYGPVSIARPLDQAGRASIILDLFLGTSTGVAAVFQDGSRREVDIRTEDMASVSKIAIVWKADVNLDLHAYEFTARDNDPGHVWAGATDPAEAARDGARKSGRGHGFLGMVSDAATPGDKVEVYTFWHSGDGRGVVTLALDYETRGDVPGGQTCGTGVLASMAFTVWRLPRGAATALSEERSLSAVPCGVPLAREVRFNPDSVPHLSVR